MNKNKKTKTPKRKVTPYGLRSSFTNLFTRATIDDQSEDEISVSSAIERHKSAEDVRVGIPNNFNNSILETTIMATQGTSGTVDTSVAAKQVFESLRIPDAIKDLPKFDGNPRLLHDFIRNVEEILRLIRAIDGTFYGQILIRAIRNKIECQADEVLNMYGTPLDWSEIKKNLILHYSDKRNETSLIRDIHNLKQGNKPVEKFYSEVIEIQATMFNHIQLHETDNNVIKAKRDLFSQMCLNVFLTGLREPLGSTIRAMQPDSLPVAFSYCIKEQNIFYIKTDQPSFQNKSKPNRTLNPVTQLQSTNFFSPQQRVPQPFQTNFLNNQPIQKLPYQPFNNSFNRQQRQFTNFNQNSNAFTPSINQFNRQNFPKPEPMDTSSGCTHLRQQTRHQPPGPNQRLSAPSNQIPNFTSKELFNVYEQNFQPNNQVYSNDYFYSNLDRYYNEHPDNNNLQQSMHSQTEVTPSKENSSDDLNFSNPTSENQSGI